MIRLLIVLLGLVGLAPGYAQDIDQVERIAQSRDFAGVILISRGDEILYYRAHGDVRPGGGEAHRLDGRWRWASITKQITATLAMREVAIGRLDLDTPIARYWPDFPNPAGATLTARQLMQHMSGLPDPEDTPRRPYGLPEFYAVDSRLDASATGYCAGPNRSAPGSSYHYTNCDFIVLGGLIERISGEFISQLASNLLPGAPAHYPDGQPTVPGYLDGQPEPPIRFERYGAAGGMNGTAMDLWQFDRALMRGELMPDEMREEMWTGDPAIGYAALGQWVFPAPLDGCSLPQMLVERPGAIVGVQGRNYMLPELDMAVIIFTNRSESEFPLGQIAHQNAFAFDILSAAACTGGAE